MASEPQIPFFPAPKQEAIIVRGALKGERVTIEAPERGYDGEFWWCERPVMRKNTKGELVATDKTRPVLLAAGQLAPAPAKAEAA
ncbi:hypothetical protein [Hymenobacter koreensis]|uniref:DUF2635 domain-containing protein n=1 Tax=Hymenobacter koreensis TaxID=1084523 RepID=A0ABP8JKV0_9BACT